MEPLPTSIKYSTQTDHGSERLRTLHLRKALQGLAASGHPFRISLSATAQAQSPSAAANASRSPFKILWLEIFTPQYWCVNQGAAHLLITLQRA